MAIARAGELLRDGWKKGYGVPMINVVNYEMVKWAIEAAEEEGMPLLIGFAPGFSRHFDPEICAQITTTYARRVKAPIALHLDHSPSLDVIAPYLKWFDSVMIDGSTLSFEENMRVTQEVVHFCKKMNIEVEAELGHVGSASSIDDIQNADHYTNVEQAKEFVEKTGCNSLAVAIGNAHGAYVATPNLDFDRLKALRAAVDVPLVLHGGSGIPDEQFSRCAAMGMSKFNIFTDYNMAFSCAAKDYLAGQNKGAMDMLMSCADACRAVIRHKIRILNPHGLRVV